MTWPYHGWTPPQDARYVARTRYASWVSGVVDKFALLEWGYAYNDQVSVANAMTGLYRAIKGLWQAWDKKVAAFQGDEKALVEAVKSAVVDISIIKRLFATAPKQAWKHGQFVADYDLAVEFEAAVGRLAADLLPSEEEA